MIHFKFGCLIFEFGRFTFDLKLSVHFGVGEALICSRAEAAGSFSSCARKLFIFGGGGKGVVKNPYFENPNWIHRFT